MAFQSYLLQCTLLVIFLLRATTSSFLDDDINTLQLTFANQKRLTEIQQQTLDAANVKLEQYLQKLDHFESYLERSKKLQTTENTPSGRHQALMRAPKQLQEKGRKAGGLVPAAAFAKKRLNIADIPISTIKLGRAACQQAPVCDPNRKYRTLDGSCNNLKNPLAGMAGTPVIRLLEPAYSDDDNLITPRSNTNLKSAREITSKVFKNTSMEDTDLTLVAMQWGQFIDHDFISSPSFRAQLYNGETRGLSCCNDGNPIPADQRHSECFHIDIPEEDPFYKEHNLRCMNFVRTLSAAPIDCKLGPRQQMNSITHYLDGSAVYGSSQEQHDKLKSQTEPWRLLTQPDDLLPKGSVTSSCPEVNGKRCFTAGDGRVNEQPGLVLMHTIWMREHNRIADYIKENNGNTMTDQQVFELTRKIVVAEIQHITYNEFLRVTLGESYGNERNLFPDENKTYYEEYDPDMDASISNAFGAAAYRYGHSLIQGLIKIFEDDSTSSVKLHNKFLSPYDLYTRSHRDGMCRGLTKQNPQTVDKYFTQSVMGRLFQSRDDKFGLDLPAINIQRGRDHGLPPYNDYRDLCGLPKVTSFAELANGDALMAENLEELYGSVDNIDLFVGGILEKHQGDSILGPTFLCIIGDQFYRLKNGDRYFYENNVQPEPFTETQLLEIKNKVTLSGIFCNNGGDIKEVPQNSFRASFQSNLVPCTQIPQMDLSKFL